jgi:diguanylate cyclase (GGDEF)-like protein
MDVDFLQQLKKKMYLFIMPFLIVAMTLGWLLDGIYETHDFVNHTIFPLLDLWFIIGLGLIIFKEKYLRIVELVSFCFVSFIYLSWLVDLVLFQPDTTFTNGGLGEFTNWVPLFYIYIALIFDRKKSLITSIFIYLISVFIGLLAIYKLNAFSNIRAMDTLLQFYFSTATYVLALYFLQHLKEAFIQKEILGKMANTDYLTGLPNRRRLETIIEDNSKSKTVFSVVLFDIDLFKEINDRYGHDTGDLVLRELTDLLNKNTRETDVLGRWGGEEFLIIANKQDKRQTVQLSERLRRIIEDHSFLKVGSVTASFGIAEYSPGVSREELVKRADIALYHSKEQGRNTVKSYETSC